MRYINSSAFALAVLPRQGFTLTMRYINIGIRVTAGDNIFCIILTMRCISSVSGCCIV